jgi:hypothetical protein
MGRVDLHPVETGTFGAAAGQGKGGDDIPDVFWGKLPDGLPDDPFDMGEAHGRLPGELGVGKYPRMGDLKDDFSAVVMDRCGHLPVSVHQIVRINTDLLRAGLAFLFYIGMAGDDQSQAALGEPDHEIRQGGGTGPVFGGHSFPGGRSDESVLELHSVDRDGFEHHFGISCLSRKVLGFGFHS